MGPLTRHLNQKSDKNFSFAFDNSGPARDLTKLMVTGIIETSVDTSSVAGKKQRSGQKKRLNS